MTDLERRALLGDRETQEECTEKGIILPCPFCGSQGKIIDLGKAYLAVCEICGASVRISSEKERAVESWNTRTAPPVGRCGTCMWGLPDIESPWPDIFCDQFDKWLLKDDFCSCYEPKEADENE